MDLLRAKNLGARLVPNLLFPALPRLLRDLWVFIELFVTFFQFSLALGGISESNNVVVTVFYITLSTINFILACIDGFLYFYELGSCALLYKSIKTQFNKAMTEENDRLSEINDKNKEDDQNGMEQQEQSDEKTRKCKCIHLSEKRRQQLNTWFELIRTILSEFLLYPLIVFDLFDVVRKDFLGDRINVTLFMFGNFYLVTSVYIMRAVMLILTLRTIRGLLSRTQTGSSNIRFFIRFVVHTLFQVLVHLSCVGAVGIKIYRENRDDDEYHSSPILWIVMFGGWIVPFLGIFFFFISNNFWIQQFSTGVFIEMISLLEGPNVSDVLFEGTSDIENQAAEKSRQILEKVNVEGIRDEYKSEMLSVHLLSKLIYPLKVPLMFILSLVYFVILLVFEICLLLKYDNGTLSLVNLSDPSYVILILLMILIALGNAQFIAITFIGLLGMMLVLLMAILPGFISVPFTYGMLQLKRRFDTSV